MKIAGLPLIGIVLATILYWMLGAIWYGFLFAEPWMEIGGYSEADFEGQSALWMFVGGPLITLLQVIGLGLILKWRGWPALGGAIGTALILAVTLALPFVGYALIYTPQHSVEMFLIDGGHMTIGWVLSAIVLTLFGRR